MSYAAAQKLSAGQEQIICAGRKCVSLWQRAASFPFSAMKLDPFRAVQICLPASVNDLATLSSHAGFILGDAAQPETLRLVIIRGDFFFSPSTCAMVF